MVFFRFIRATSLPEVITRHYLSILRCLSNVQLELARIHYSADYQALLLLLPLPLALLERELGNEARYWLSWQFTLSRVMDDCLE